MRLAGDGPDMLFKIDFRATSTTRRPIAISPGWSFAAGRCWSAPVDLAVGGRCWQEEKAIKSMPSKDAQRHVDHSCADALAANGRLSGQGLRSPQRLPAAHAHGRRSRLGARLWGCRGGVARTIAPDFAVHHDRSAASIVRTTDFIRKEPASPNAVCEAGACASTPPRSNRPALRIHAFGVRFRARRCR